MTLAVDTRKFGLLSYLRSQKHDDFTVRGRIDDRRFLPRQFPEDIPVMISLQAYPGYRRMIGEQWMHWHDYYEFWLATGSGQYRSGNHQFSFAPGDVVLVDPLKLHGVIRMEPNHSPLVIFFRAEAVVGNGSDVDRGFLAAFDERAEKVPPRMDANAASASSVHSAMLRLAQVWFERQGSEDRTVELRFHLLEVLLELRRAFLPHGHSVSNTLVHRAERMSRLNRILEYVGERCQDVVRQPEVARFVGMSTSRFRAFFKETTGWGFSDYLRDLRLERAARLLRETTDSVASVAGQAGFADQSHLQRLFKAKYAVSPLAYRKAHQQS